jgi:arsenate reductase
MAEAFLRHHAGEHFDAYSAGLDPKPISPLARFVMQEIGLDLKGQSSKDVGEYMGRIHFGYLITVCATAEASCPTVFPGIGMRMHWDFDDPSRVTGTEEQILEVYRRVRDQVDARIRKWLLTLEENSLIPITSISG